MITFTVNETVLYIGLGALALLVLLLLLYKRSNSNLMTDNTNGQEIRKEAPMQSHPEPRPIPLTTVTLFYADWCGHCKTMKPVWQRVKDEIKARALPIEMTEVDAEKNKVQGIKGFPTIIKFSPSGEPGPQYTSGPDYQKLLDFVSQ